MKQTIEERAQEIRKAALSGYPWNVPAAWEDAHPVARAHWMEMARKQILSELNKADEGASTPQNDPAKYALEAMRGGNGAS